MKKCLIWTMAAAVLVIFITAAGCTGSSEYVGDTGTGSVVSITDSFGRTVTIPSFTNEVVCSSGGGCVRYLV